MARSPACAARMNAALPAMSSRPTTTSLGTTSGGSRHGWRPTTITMPSTSAWTSRTMTSRPNALSPLNCPTQMLNRPIAMPAMSAHRIPDGRSVPTPGVRVTRTTATSATRMPATVAGAGRPSVRNPNATGTVALRTPVTGATTPIRPTASPRYRLVMPTTPHRPPITAHPMSGADGNGSASRIPRPSAATMPTSWVMPTTPNNGARRVISPPPKSPAPQLSAETRPSTTTAAPGPSSGSGWFLGLDVPVGRGRSRELHDAIGQRVVAVRRREVDHLEVGRDLLEQLQGAGGTSVVEGHERVVQDQRRPPVAGHEPDQPEPGGEVDDVQRALGQVRDRDPVALLRRVHLDAEVGVVDTDPAVATVGHPRHVLDHPPLQVAGRALHRRLLGRVDLAEGHRVHALAALQDGQLVGPAGEALRQARNLLGIDGVLLHAGARVGLVVASPFLLTLGVVDLDLEPLPGPGLLRDRAERVERRGLLLDLQRRGVAHLGQPLARLVPHEAGEPGTPLVDRGDMRLLGPEPRLGLRGQLHLERLVIRNELRLGGLELVLDLGPAPEPAVHLGIAKVLLHPVLAAPPPSRDPEPDADEHDHDADDRQQAPEPQDAERVEQEATDADRDPDQGEDQGQPRQRLPVLLGCRLEVDLDLAREHLLQRRDLGLERAQPLHRGPQHRQRLGRGVASVEGGQLVPDDDRGPVPLVAFPRGLPLGCQAFSLAGLLEQGPPLVERLLGLGPALACLRQRVAITFQPGQRVLARAELAGHVGDRVLGDLQPAGVLGAARAQPLERPIELLASPAGAAVGAADRRLEAVAQGRLVALQPGELVVADRRGRAEEALGRHAGQLRQPLVGADRVGDDLVVDLEPHGS